MSAVQQKGEKWWSFLKGTSGIAIFHGSSCVKYYKKEVCTPGQSLQPYQVVMLVGFEKLQKYPDAAPWIPTMIGFEWRTFERLLGLPTRTLFEAYWPPLVFQLLFHSIISFTHTNWWDSCGWGWGSFNFLSRVVASISSTFSNFCASLAPPSALFLYSHAHSYACSRLDALILQTSFSFHMKKWSDRGAECMEGCGRRKGGGEHSNMAYD